MNARKWTANIELNKIQANIQLGLPH